MSVKSEIKPTHTVSVIGHAAIEHLIMVKVQLRHWIFLLFLVNLM